MAFVNERPLEEDVQKYGLDELLKKYNPRTWSDKRPRWFCHNWTIDRDRNIYLTQAKVIQELGLMGRSEDTNDGVWILYVDGAQTAFTLKRLYLSQTSLENPYRIGWQLLSVDMGLAPVPSRNAVLEILKEALTTYGHDGVFRQVPNSVVSFDF